MIAQHDTSKSTQQPGVGGKAAAPKDFTKGAEKAPEKPGRKLSGLESWPVADLLALREEIDRLVPSAALKDINLEAELVSQYAKIKTLQSDVMADQDTPVNQKAQVANSCAATLGQLTKMQSDFYTSERFKSIEGILIKYLKTLPESMVLEFFNEYEALNA